MLREMLKEYRSSEMFKAIIQLWKYFREECHSNKETLYKKFRGMLEEDLYSEFNEQRRFVTQFYQSLAHFYIKNVISSDNIYKNWSEDDLSIIPQVLIPLGKVLLKIPLSQESEYHEDLNKLYENSKKI